MNIKTKVNWSSERTNESDSNKGKEYGYYVFDCKESKFDAELGYGVYSVLESHWFKTKKARDFNFDLIENTLLQISNFVEKDGTVVQEKGFEQTPVHHLTKKLLINGDVIPYIGKEGIFTKSGKKHIYKNLTNNQILQVRNLITI